MPISMLTVIITPKWIGSMPSFIGDRELPGSGAKMRRSTTVPRSSREQQTRY